MNAPCSPPVGPDAEVHPLSGSSPPGAGAPSFEPVTDAPAADRRSTTARTPPPGLHLHPLGLRDVSDERDIIERTRHLAFLLKHEGRLADRIDDEPLNGQTAAQHYRMDRSLHRTVNRIQRLTAELARTKAPTIRAAAAKGDLYIEMAVLGLTADQEAGALALSLAHDACHLAIEASCVEGALDGSLFELIERHELAEALKDRAAERLKQVRKAFEEARPPLPEALYWRGEDGFNCGTKKKQLRNGNVALFYDIPNVAKLQATPVPMHRREVREPFPGDDAAVIVRTIKVPDDKWAARVAEIVAAADDLMVQTEALAEQFGLPASIEEADAAAVIAQDAEDAVVTLVPQTTAGWVAKAHWLAERRWDEDECAQVAMHMVRDMARLPAMRRLEFAGEPMAAVPDRRTLEAYRTFLEFERRYVEAEMGLTEAQTGGFWLDNPSGRFDYRAPPPSTRAATVLGLFGLMPVDDDVAPPAAEVAA